MRTYLGGGCASPDASLRLKGGDLFGRVVDPALRSGRWFSGFLLNRPAIGEGKDGSAGRREIFATFFGLFSVFHVFNYAFEYGRFPPSWDLILVLLAGLTALFRPSSARALFLLMLVSTISTVVQAPAQSNHTMVRSAAILGYWLSFALAMARRDRTTMIFERFAPAGCGALLVMYFFGIFHKINTDFLDPETSCATALWRRMPTPLATLDGPLIQWSAIYGTFIVEGAIAAALLTRKWRHIGVAAGIFFHLLLSLSSYAMYISFTMLALALHTLFLNETAARAVLSSPLVRTVRAKLAEPIYKVLVVALISCLAVFAFTGRYTFASLAAFPLILPFCWAVLRYGSAPGPYVSRSSTLTVGALTTALFFVNSSLPYLGLKTAQTVNMFANLRLEAGMSNHLVFTDPPGPFNYLEDVAVIEDGGGDQLLEWHRQRNMGIVYYDLLSRLEQKPDLIVSYVMNGAGHDRVSASDLTSDIDATLHSPWMRKWFHFQPVSLERPERCNI